MCTRHYDCNSSRYVECIWILPCPFIVTLDENAILICILTIISFAYSFMMSKNVIVFAFYGLLSADAIMMCSLFISL